MWGGSSDIKTTSLCQLAALETDLISEQVPENNSQYLCAACVTLPAQPLQPHLTMV